MKKVLLALSLCLTMTTSEALAQKYHVTKISRDRITVDSTYTNDADGMAFLAPFKQVVDSTMAPVVGYSAKYMKSYLPESELSNLLSDIMIWGGKLYNEKPVVGLYNIGGIRAALPKGTITFGDINDIAPFENKICFLTLNGKQLKQLFQDIAHKFGSGVSHAVKAVYRKSDMSLISLSINGEEVQDDANYRIATIDYLIHGNDGFQMLQQGKDMNLPTDHESNTRYLIADYFREKMAANEVVDANIEGRVEVKE